MPRLLLIDDDRFLLRSVEQLLAKEGYCCHTAISADEARRVLNSDSFDMVVMDVGLPDVDGFALCRQLRARHRMPILFLSGRSDSSDKIIGLEVGADDYLTKPFEPRELVARVRAHLRRAQEYSQPIEAANQVVLGGLNVDMDRRDAFCDGTPANLTEREFELLSLLARHPHKALATEWIFENVWGYNAELGLKTLAVYVRRLRQKIELSPDNPRYLVTIRGFGYKLTTC